MLTKKTPLSKNYKKKRAAKFFTRTRSVAGAASYSSSKRGNKKGLGGEEKGQSSGQKSRRNAYKVLFLDLLSSANNGATHGWKTKSLVGCYLKGGEEVVPCPGCLECFVMTDSEKAREM